MRNLSKTILAVLATGLLSCALFSQQTQAGQITGTISFNGGVKLDPSNVNTASEAESWSNTRVLSSSGDFATYTTTNDPAVFAPEWTFVNAQPALWQAGGFTFDLSAGSTVVNSPFFVLVTGNGFVSGNGFSSTAGTFSFSVPVGSSHGTFTFAASTITNPTPDGGSAVILLGMALAGIEIVRRKIKAA